MNDKITKEPEIRFTGFTDAWEQRKFSDMFYERRDKTKSENEDTLLSCAINGMFLNSELFGHFRGSSTIGYLKVKKNDLILSAQNLHLGNANVNLRFETGIISPAYKVFNLIECDSNFVQAWVKKDTTKEFFLACTTEGASVCRKNIDWNELNSKKIPVPNYEEQKKLGEYFLIIDDLITLHQRQLGLLKQNKKAMLQKMFPKNGSNFPEIRFAGFNDAWEQRKFGDIAHRISSTGISSEEAPSVEYEDVISEQGLLNKDISKKQTTKTGIKFSGEEVLYGKLRPYLHNWLNPDFSGIAVGDWWVLNPINSDKNFLYRLIQTPQFDDMANQSSGTKMPRADWKLISSTEFCIPTDLREQKKIGAYFTNLDNLITLQQREMDSIIKLKKSMLQKMFI